MISFESDYIAGAHLEVIARLAETNLECVPGYCEDHYCASAREKIRAAVGIPDADVEFLVGGTQTNAIVISTMLADHEGVIAAKTGHVSTHEAGAIEYAGHKVLELDHQNGKIDPGAMRAYVEGFYADENHEHMVFPGMVYISYPTECGTLYSKNELMEIADICHEYGMHFFIDGARLGYGLMSRKADVTLQELAQICDVFYIGGTKMGALCAEAVVFTKGNKPAHFMNLIKKRGALLAKGRLLGVQFDALFTDNLYMEMGKHAVSSANTIRKELVNKGYQIYMENPTNQIFVVMENDKLDKLSKEVLYGFWEKYDDAHTVIRIATSWATTEASVEALKKIL